MQDASEGANCVLGERETVLRYQSGGPTLAETVTALWQHQAA